MIIKRLTLNNFGVYAGENTFAFSNARPIALIGGMNGRGKTTFLDAILLSLYGPNSIAFKESRHRSYGQYLRSYVNAGHRHERCFVEIDIVMNESTGDEFCIRREWDASEANAQETVTVIENGVANDYLAQNWAMFVENILPSALSSFYFFDGEKIAELAVDDTDAQLKDSIRSMLGIGILDVLKSDLKRSLRQSSKKAKDDGSVVEMERMRVEVKELEVDRKKLDDRISVLNADIAGKQAELDALHERYKAKGGSAIDQRQALMRQRADLRAEIDMNQSELTELAAGELPLLLVRDLIGKIKLQAEDERNDFVMQEALGRIETLLMRYSAKHTAEMSANRGFVDFVRSETEAGATKRIYDVSEHALFQLNTLLEARLDESRAAALNCLRRKDSLKQELDKVEGYIAAEINEDALQKIYASIQAKEAGLVEMRADAKEAEQRRTSIESALRIKNAAYKRAVDEYLVEKEARDDSGRMVKYTNIALDILDGYTTELQKRKTAVLGATITRCYKQLANKKNMIERIEMDPQSLDLRYYDGAGGEVRKSSLSAGEKQLMVVAILWALAICSKKKLPVIIDTPLSRLDSVHRTALVTTYFPQASDQTIILSTDSEIGRAYYELMKESVGDEFTLEYDEETRSTTILRGYFR